MIGWAQPPCMPTIECPPTVRGLVVGRTTGAKALFCLTAEIILAGEKEKMPGVAPAALERLVLGVLKGSVGE